MDSRAPPAGWSRYHRPEIFGGSSSTRAAREWSSPAGGCPRVGQNAHSENNGYLHPDWISTPAIHTRPFARGFDWHSHLQSADWRIYDQTRPDFFKFDPGRRNQSRACKGTKRVA